MFTYLFSKTESSIARQGVIVVLEFCAFTSWPPQKQIDAIVALHSLLSDHLPKSSRWNPRSDGVLISWPDGNRQCASAIRQFLNGVREGLVEKKIEIRLRAAIHRGDFFSVGSAANAKASIIGTTVNDALWLSRFAGPEDTIVSEPYFDLYVKSDPSMSDEAFKPPRDQNPIELERASERHLRFRFVDRGEDARSSQPFRLLDQVRQRIMAQLELLEYLLRSYLDEDAGVRVPAARLRARISIWERRTSDGAEVLHPTHFRFTNPPDPRSILPGTTRYSLKGDGQGPPGVAIRKNSVVAINHLPAWAKQPLQYRESLQEYNADRELIDPWYRKARSFICFPIGMFEPEPGEMPDACICIDCLDPLTRVSRDKLTQIGEQLREDADETLAVLWQQRSII